MAFSFNFVSPRTHLPLVTEAGEGALVALDGERFAVTDGIPQLLIDMGEEAAASTTQADYRAKANDYDRGNDVMFQMLLSEEGPTREAMVAQLRLHEGATVLEVGCGTCRDTIHLLKCAGAVYACDLAREMVMVGRSRLERAGADLARVRLFVADAMNLPFADGTFDAVYHFGELNLFPDVRLALAEMARVVRLGGRVVAGDEGVAPWLRDTDFARILQNSNPLFHHEAPLAKLPALARDVSCTWVLNGSFYSLAFTVGSGEPQLDLDVEFPGWRGGSHRKRYFGRLEGVDPALRDRVVRAAAAERISVVEWLERELSRSLS